MQLTRSEAVSCLLEDESMVRHGHASYEVHGMDQQELTGLLNRVFEPIDLDDPYTVEDFFSLTN